MGRAVAKLENQRKKSEPAAVVVIHLYNGALFFTYCSVYINIYQIFTALKSGKRQFLGDEDG